MINVMGIAEKQALVREETANAGSEHYVSGNIQCHGNSDQARLSRVSRQSTPCSP